MYTTIPLRAVVLASEFSTFLRILHLLPYDADVVTKISVLPGLAGAAA